MEAQLVQSWLALLMAAAPLRGEVVGEVRTVQVAQGESLVELARRFDLGFSELSAANPGLDPFVPGEGASVLVPTSWIVPDLEPGEILVNLSELRLYLLAGGGREPRPVTFPIGIGHEGKPTPLGTFRVTSKERDPAWRVPASVRRERPEVPAVVPPGPDNPLGTHALRLSRREILIHGTNRPFGIGRRVSHGCIRLYPEDIPELYRLAPVGTAVRVVRWPVKAATVRGRVHVEVHDDPAAGVDLLGEARAVLRRRGLLDLVDPEKLRASVRARSGVPVDVGR